MPGSSNFLQFNPGAVNQETDSAYNGDSTRAGGIAFNQIMSSLLGNKVLFQLSTFVTAMAQALANKGLVLSDANLAALTSVLAGVIVNSDIIVSVGTSTWAGHIKLGPVFGNIHIEWGTVNLASSGSIIITYNSAYVNSALPFAVASGSTGSVTPSATCAVENIANSGFSIVAANVPGGGCNFNWFAIGT